MDAADLSKSSSPTVVPRLLSADVDMDCFTGEPEGSGWSRIECRRSIAYGCGARGQAVADGLTLYDWPELGLDTRDPKDVLAVCTPATLAAPGASTTAGSPWVIKERRVRGNPPPPLPFIADMVFSHRGLALWADLSQGLLYCDPRKPGSAMAYLHFIPLPPMYMGASPDDDQDDDNEESMWLTRTMGRHGRSNICFVSDDSGGDEDDHLTRSSVRMWLLDLAEPHGGWSKELEISFQELWEMDGFRDAGLPEAWPICPALLPDGTLSLLMPDKSQETRSARSTHAPIVDHLCCFDMLGRRLMWRRTVRDGQGPAPVILPLHFLLNEAQQRASDTQVEAISRE
ncbi:hypothetical protein ACP4OV_001709 [Aristida adscensionis]